MEESRNGQLRKKRKVPHICLLLLVLLQITAPSSAQNTTITATTLSALRYSTRPAGVQVAVGEPAVFNCGVPQTSPNFTFTIFGSHGYSILTCPFGHQANIPQAWTIIMSEKSGADMTKYDEVTTTSCVMANHAIQMALYGSCAMKNGESLGVWVIKGTSFSDNGTRVVCQQIRNPKSAVAYLHVYDNGVSYATLIGCAIGGFFGILLVFGLAYAALQRSETLQRFFRGSVPDDMTSIVTKE